PKQNVAGSNPVSRSNSPLTRTRHLRPGAVCRASSVSRARPSCPVGRLAWSQLDKCDRELSVGTERRIGRLLGADLDANLICARREVVADAFGDRVDVAPGDDRVDQAS